MIKNQRQRHNTGKQIEEFRNAIDTFGTEPPEGTSKVMHAATLEGMRSMLITLEREADEYDRLAAGEVDSIAVESLDDLPKALIKARIARGHTQKQLASTIGVTPQQVQRWEFEDYENVGFARLVDIANALMLDVSQLIALKSQRHDSLEDLGIDRSFLKKRLVPQPAPPDLESQIVAAAMRLKRIFGIETASRPYFAPALLTAGGTLRFKLPRNAHSKRTMAYSVYVEYLSRRVAYACRSMPKSPIPRDPSALANLLFGDGPQDFRKALHALWDLGVPVLPLSDSIRFHGSCVRVEHRNVIVLKQSIRQPSRWLFDLVHELYHAGEDPSLATFGHLDSDPTETARRDSEEELAANDFAGNVLLGGHANDLYAAVLKEARYRLPLCKQATSVIAARQRVDVGVLANYVAFRLKTDQGLDWWGTAQNLQPDSDDAFELARDQLLERTDFSKLSEDDQNLLRQAVDETVN